MRGSRKIPSLKALAVAAGGVAICLASVPAAAQDAIASVERLAVRVRSLSMAGRRAHGRQARAAPQQHPERERQQPPEGGRLRRPWARSRRARATGAACSTCSTSGSASATSSRRPARRLQRRMTEQIYTLAGTYRVVNSPSMSLDLLAGARYATIKTTVNVQPEPARRSGPGRHGRGPERRRLVERHHRREDAGAGRRPMVAAGLRRRRRRRRLDQLAGHRRRKLPVFARHLASSSATGP